MSAFSLSGAEGAFTLHGFGALGAPGCIGDKDCKCCFRWKSCGVKWARGGTCRECDERRPYVIYDYPGKKRKELETSLHRKDPEVSEPAKKNYRVDLTNYHDRRACTGRNAAKHLTEKVTSSLVLHRLNMAYVPHTKGGAFYSVGTRGEEDTRVPRGETTGGHSPVTGERIPRNGGKENQCVSSCFIIGTDGLKYYKIPIHYIYYSDANYSFFS